jgi:NADH dehydrogenase
MTVCITGSTGFVGTEVLSKILAAGHTVHALVRRGSEGRVPNSDQCIPFTGDALRRNDVVQALRGCDAVIHLVGIKRAAIKRTGLNYDDVDVASAQVMVEGMTACNVERIV